MTLDEEIISLIGEWAPEVTDFLDEAGYWSLPRNHETRKMIVKKLGLQEGGKLLEEVKAASLKKNGNIWKIVLNEYSLRSFKEGARSAASQLNIPFTAYDWNERAQRYFENHGMFFVRSMTQTDIDSLRDRILYDFSLSPDAFAAKFAASYSCAPYRLERIKRTEVHTSNEGGAWNLADEAGAEYKQWMCTPRSIWPRATHRAMWYKIAAMNQPFSNGLYFPSDVNCRCFLLFFFNREHLNRSAAKNLSVSIPNRESMQPAPARAVA